MCPTQFLVYLMQKSTAEEGERRGKDTRCTENKRKVAAVNSAISVVEWNVKGLNTPVKRQILPEYIKKI